MNFPSAPSFSAQGKRALVTGASSGMGQACTVTMARAEASIDCRVRGFNRLNETDEPVTVTGWDAHPFFLGTAPYLAQDASSLVKGTHFLVDGGWTSG
jgi:2-deoxy-D-gluconate 3-dehydrogenase